MRPAAIVVIVLLVAVAVATAAARPTKRLDRDSASGATAEVSVSGERVRPRRFRLDLTSDPSGSLVEGSVSISCRNTAYNFTDRTRPLSETTPARIKLAPTKRRPAYCSVAVNAASLFSADGSATGLLTATLAVKPRR